MIANSKPVSACSYCSQYVHVALCLHVLIYKLINYCDTIDRDSRQARNKMAALRYVYTQEDKLCTPSNTVRVGLQLVSYTFRYVCASSN